MEHLNLKDTSLEEMIILFLNGELTHSEEEALNQWLQENPGQQIVFEEIKNLWLSSSINSSPKGVSAEKAWMRVANQCNIAQGTNHQPHQTRTRTYAISRILSVAASLLIVFFLGVIGSKFFRKTQTQLINQICEINTPLGSKTSIVLPDGTKVWLNAGSKLTYNQAYNIKDRRVTLEGEAFFKVTTNHSKPFLVHTSHLDVRAVGTEFNVKAYPDEKLATATLVEGIIKIEVPRQNQNNLSYTLKPRENITLVNDNISIDEALPELKPKLEVLKSKSLKNVTDKIFVAENIHTELYTSWKDKRWEIEGEQLGSLAIMLERRFNVSIHFKDETLKAYKFTGIIQNENIEQVMEILKLTAPLKYQLGKGIVWLDIDSNLLDNYSKILDKKN